MVRSACRRSRVGLVGDKIGSPRSPIDQGEHGVGLTQKLTRAPAAQVSSRRILVMLALTFQARLPIMIN